MKAHQKKWPGQNGSSAQAESRKPAEVYPKVHVLVIQHSDGFIQVYGDDGVSVKVVTPPAMNGPGWEALAEKWVESRLPQYWRTLLVGECLKAQSMPRQYEPEKVADQEYNRFMMRGLDAIAKRMASPVVMQQDEIDSSAEGDVLWTQY